MLNIQPTWQRLESLANYISYKENVAFWTQSMNYTKQINDVIILPMACGLIVHAHIREPETLVVYVSPINRSQHNNIQPVYAATPFR